MITDDHKQAIQELLKLVQAKMGGSGDNPEEEMSEMGTQPDTEGAQDSPSLEEMSAEQGEGPDVDADGNEKGNSMGLDSSIIDDMKKKFSGREDLNMPDGKKGIRMGVTEISAMPMKKPMRR